MDGRQFHVRSWALSGVMLLLLLALGVGLYRIQIVKGDYYAELSRRSIANMETIEANRGIITDTNGQPLVINRVSYQVTLDTGRMGDEGQRTAILSQLLDICVAGGVEWTDSLPITTQPPFEFTEGEPFYYQAETEDGRTEWKQTRLFRLAKAMRWIKTGDGPVDLPTAQELLDTIYRELEIPTGDAVKARRIAGVLYELYLRSKDIYRTPYIFARDVDIDFISRVKEQGLPGVNVKPVSVRQYETEYAAHLLGRVGLMDAEEWAVYKEKDLDADGNADYEMDDSVGKEGVERVFESWLRGRTGLRSVELNTSGKVVSQEWIKEPEAGSTVELTIDIELQRAVEKALARRIPQLASEKTEGAAAVVINVKDGGVLACASYPTFNLANYSADYNENVTNPLKPLYNRALLGTYAPGSTFKMVTGIAGLEEGLITPNTQILDTGVYRYYDDNGPRCWIYNQGGGTHGQQTVADAIKNSCNIFFYDVGRRLGIEVLREYAAMFGLGEKTGLELSERAGIMAGPEYTESLGGTWYPGSTLSVAIGQESSQFTPIQLANYVATLVNGGTRYKTHLLDRVIGADGSVVHQYQPEVLDTLNLNQKNLNAVKAGMLALTREGSLAKYFEDLPVAVGAKTGSAQVGASTKVSNAVLVCFAPFDDPEIALAIVAEKGGGGSELGAVAVDIFKWYFQEELVEESADVEPEAEPGSETEGEAEAETEPEPEPGE